MYWAFLISIICLLIYLCARLFSKDSLPVQGVLAVITFLAIEDIAKTNGTPGVDLTAIFIILVIVLVYLLSIRSKQNSKWLVMIIGALFYMAFKTKETAIIAGILVFGLGFTEENLFNWREFKKNFKYIGFGLFAGMILFSVWSWVALKGPVLWFAPFRMD